MHISTFLKQLLLTGLILMAFISYGQEEKIKIPEYVIVANNEIITKEQLTSYGEQGMIKGMNKGVSEEKRTQLSETFGDKIGEKEFIIMIDLFSKEELKEKKPAVTSTTKVEKPDPKDDGFVLRAGDAAANFTVQLTNGTEIRLSDLKGKVVLLNFWATWCAPCLMEFYHMPETILTPFKDQPFVFLPVSIGESMEKVTKKMAQLNKKGLHFDAGIDPEKAIWNQYGTHGIPRNFLIDQNGMIQYVSAGYSEENLAAIAKEIKALLKKN